MNIFYINLPGAIKRRSDIETSLGTHAKNTPVERIPAISIDDVLKSHPPGRILPAEKACVMSHIKALERSLNFPGPALILEDDAILGSRTMTILDEILPNIKDCDILYTDLIVGSFALMLQLFKLRKSVEENTVLTGDCRNIEFCGTTAYVVPNDDAKRKILSMLKTQPIWNAPYDLFLVEKIRSGGLNGSFLFPFITSQSSDAAQSQIGPAENQVIRLVYNSFRKLMFLESQQMHDDLESELEVVPADFYDREATILAGIWKLMLSKKFPISCF